MANAIRTNTFFAALVGDTLPVAGVSEVAAQHGVDDATKVSWHTKGAATIRVDWSVVPTQANKDRVDVLLGAHDPLVKSAYELLQGKIRDKTATAAEKDEFLSKLAGI